MGLFLIVHVVSAQYTWVQKNNFSSLKRDFIVGFAINNKGYMGGGWDQASSSAFGDFWEYDPGTDSWSQKADIVGGAISNVMCFVLNNKGYFCGGTSGPGLAPKQSLWQYNPANNSWMQKNNIPGSGGRWAGLAVAMNNKGYLGFGNLDQLSGPVLMNDFWEYNDATDTWTALNSFPGSGRLNPVGFSIGNTIYFGTGWDGNSVMSDFWAYDRTSNTWTEKQGLPGPPRLAGTGFSWNGKGFIGSGVGNDFTSGFLQDFYVYDPTSDTWSTVPDLPPIGRDGDLSFITNGHPYVMCGNSNTGVRNDVYELVLNTIYDTVNLTICQGQNYYKYKEKGTYVDTFIVAGGKDSIRTLNLSVFNMTISSSPDTIIVLGDSAELLAQGSGAVSIIWSPSLTLSDSNTFSVIAKPDTSTIYHVIATSDSGCLAIDSIVITVIKHPLWFAPNAFTPNNDGRNDYFKIFTIGEVQILSLKIFDRWGEMIFQQEGDSPGWNGKYKDKVENTGTFVYLAEIQYSSLHGNPLTKSLKGSFVLLR